VPNRRRYPAPMSVRVLIVDDDASLLRAIQRVLGQFELTAARSTEEALAILSGRTFDAVLTDYRVPTSNGVVFLSRVAELCPKARRYLMSGAELDRLAAHVTSALVHRMFAKPLDVVQLRDELATLGFPQSRGEQ
jgi:DNA-binding NtrC family response regulator